MDLLNVAAIARWTQALGPGNRAVVWVQGCPINCPGCLASNWIPVVPAMLLTPVEILGLLDLEKIEGLTFSGGEPFYQARGLAALARLARREKELDLLCFTGYRYERLVKNPPNIGVPELLEEVDVLIDGPFVQTLNDASGLRGSSNQRVIHLTSRLRDYDLESQSRSIDVRLLDDKLAFIGIPTPDVMLAMKSANFTDTERTET